MTFPRGRAAVIGAVVVVIAAIAVVVVRAQRGESDVRGPMNEVIAPRDDAAVTWAGDRLFVFGGYVTHDHEQTITGPAPLELFTDGALVNPVTEEAEKLPPAPFDSPLYHPTAVTAGRYVVVTGLSCGDLQDVDGGDYECGHSGRYVTASFHLDNGAWRTVKAPAGAPFNFSMRLLGATSDGRALWESGGLGHSTEALTPPQFWTYRPATDEWTELPNVGVVQDSVCIADDQLVVLTSDFEQAGTVIPDDPSRVIRPGQSVSVSPSDGYVLPSLRIFDLSGGNETWQATEVDTDVKYDAGGSPPQLVCMGRHTLVVGFALRVWDESSGWSTPSDPPSRVALGSPSVWTGDLLLLWTSGVGQEHSAQSYDPVANEWHLEPTLAEAISDVSDATPAPVWTGRDVVAYLPERGDTSERGWSVPQSASIAHWQPPTR